MRALIQSILVLISLGFIYSAIADSDIYLLAKQQETTQLNKLLLEQPRAWDTGEDYLGDTPVGIAITEANLPALKLFVEHGFKLNPKKWFDHPVRLISPDSGRDTPKHMEVLSWILSQIDNENRNLDIDYHLTNFVKTNHLDGAKRLLEYGVDPNLWVYQFYSVWDLAESKEMRNLLDAHGAKSNFRRLIAMLIGGVIFLFLLARFILKPKQNISSDGSAVKPERNKKKGLWYRAIGLLTTLSGGVLIALIKYGSVLGIGRPDEPFIFVGIGVLMLAFGIRMILMGEKLSMRDAEEVLEQKTGVKTDRPTFLYLRSFILDEEDGDNSITLPYVNVPINPWESSLALAFGRVGDVIAIGRPGEKLATTGALRLYVNDDEWQDKVLEMIEKSDLVIWTYGDTKGLRWEISRLLKIIPPEKLVLAIPVLNLKKNKRDEVWQGAKERLDKIFPESFPEKIGNSLFIAFDKDWKSTWVDAPKPKLSLKTIATFGFWSAMGSGVKSLLVSRGYNYPKLSTGEKLLAAFFALLGWIVVGVVLTLLYALISRFI